MAEDMKEEIFKGDLSLPPAWAKRALDNGESALWESALKARIYVPVFIADKLDEDIVRGLVAEVFGEKKTKDSRVGFSEEESHCEIEVPSSYNKDYLLGDESNPYYRGPESVMEKIMLLGR